jgi:hypothetical protein
MALGVLLNDMPNELALALDVWREVAELSGDRGFTEFALNAREHVLRLEQAALSDPS